MATQQPSVGTKDTSVEWYQAELEDVNSHARGVLETYSGVSPAQVVPHVLKIVSHSFSILLGGVESLAYHQRLHIFLYRTLKIGCP